MRRVIPVVLVVGMLTVAGVGQPAATGAGADPTTTSASPPTTTGGSDITVSMSLSSSSLVAAASGPVAVSGTVTCDQTAEVSISIQLDQTVPQPVTGSGYVEPIACGPTAATWSTEVATSPTGVANGPATLTLNAFAFSNTSAGFAQQTDPVTISGVVTPSHPIYYLALGDSLATGFAAGPGQGYVDLLEAHYQAENPNLVEVDFGCSSETTQTMLDGGICSFGGLSQEDAAVAFLNAHPGQVALVTIDIGGNDIVFCSDPTCFANALTTMDANVATILSRLRAAAGPDVPFYGMTYFDPLLGNWLDGTSGQALADATVPLLDELNAHLVTDYSAVGAPSADVAGAFASDDFTLVDTPWGTIPRNVYNACRWLDITCTPGQPEGFGDDANAAGYQVIAAAFEAVIAPLPPPATTPTSTTPTSTSSPATSADPRRHRSPGRARGRGAGADRLIRPPIPTTVTRSIGRRSPPRVDPATARWPWPRPCRSQTWRCAVPSADWGCRRAPRRAPPRSGAPHGAGHRAWRRGASGSSAADDQARLRAGRTASGRRGRRAGSSRVSAPATGA